MNKCPICGGRILGPKEKAQPEEFVCPCNWTGTPTPVPFPTTYDIGIDPFKESTGRPPVEDRTKSPGTPVLEFNNGSSRTLGDGWKRYAFPFQEPKNWTHGFPFFRKRRSYTLSVSFEIKGFGVEDFEIRGFDVIFEDSKPTPQPSHIPKSKYHV